MPFFSDNAVPGPISALADPEQREAPELLTTLGAAFRTENLVGSAIADPGGFEPDEPFDPTHDPFAFIQGTKFEQHIDRFVKSGNERETRLTMERIEREEEDRAILAESGFAGFAAGMIAGVVDLPTLLPGGTIVQGARRGVAITRSARNVAGAAGVGVGVQEAGLQSTQELRTPEETAFNIAGGVVLGGLLGAAAGSLSKAQFNSLGQLVERELNVPPEGTPDPFIPGSAGAASKTDGVDNTLKGAFGVQKVVSVQDPLIRLQTSSSPAAQKHIQELAETPLVLAKNVEGSPTAPEGLATGAPGAVETRIKMWDAPLSDSLQELDRLFLQYRGRVVAPGSVRAKASLLRTNVEDLVGRSERLTYVEFKEAVGRAMRAGDASDVPEVAAAAKFFRRKLYDPLKDEAVNAKILDEDIDVATADSYLNRVYDKERIIQERGRFRSIVERWMRDERDVATKAVREAGEKAEARLTSRAARTDQEIESVADEIIDRILGTPDGRLPYDAASDSRGRKSDRPAGVRGPLRARIFNIPDKLIEEFLENDIESLSRAYKRTLSADAELAKRFSDVELTAETKEIVDDFNRQISDAKTPAQRKKLDKQKNAAVRDLAAIRDRLRGTYAIPSDPSSIIVRTGRVVRSLNYLRLLGGMTISAIPDIARPVMVHGFNRVFGNGFAPMVRNMNQFRLAANEVKMAGTALDMVLDSRTMSIADIMDDFGRHSKFERAVQGAASRFGVVSLMAPWNAAMKQFAGVITMTRILDAADAVKAGKASAKEIENLAQSGIDRAMATRIADEFSKSGSKEDGVSFANTAEWADRSVVEAFRAAVVRDVDRTIVTPGQDRPLWMSTELGKLVGQFRSFAIASTQRTLLAGLQQRDLATLNGTAMMMGLGAVTYYLKQTNANRPVSDDPAVWAVEAFDRSGLAGWFMEVNNMTEKLTRGTVGLSAFTGRPVSRFASRNVLGAFIGPTAGLIPDLGQVSGAAFSGDFRESDVRALRRLIPLQNLFYTRRLFDEAEANIADAIGAE